MREEIFTSLVRARGDLAGVFEYDGETGYFYLYRTESPDGTKVVDSLHVISGEIELTSNDVMILWDRSQTKVALFLRDVMWGVFDCVSGQKFGGDYAPGKTPRLPPNLTFLKPTN